MNKTDPKKQVFAIYFCLLELLFQSDLFNTFQIIYMIKIVFLLKFCWQPIKGFNKPTNLCKITIFSCQWLEKGFNMSTNCHEITIFSCQWLAKIVFQSNMPI